MSAAFLSSASSTTRRAISSDERSSTAAGRAAWRGGRDSRRGSPSGRGARAGAVTGWDSSGSGWAWAGGLVPVGQLRQGLDRDDQEEVRLTTGHPLGCRDALDGIGGVGRTRPVDVDATDLESRMTGYGELDHPHPRAPPPAGARAPPAGPPRPPELRVDAEPDEVALEALGGFLDLEVRLGRDPLDPPAADAEDAVIVPVDREGIAQTLDPMHDHASRLGRLRHRLRARQDTGPGAPQPLDPLP